MVMMFFVGRAFYVERFKASQEPCKLGLSGLQLQGTGVLYQQANQQ